MRGPKARLAAQAIAPAVTTSPRVGGARTHAAPSLTRTDPAMSPTEPQALVTLLNDLAVLAREFDHEASYYDTLSAVEPVMRASASLRLVRTGLREGSFDALEGYSWLHAGRAVLRLTSYARIHGMSYRDAIKAIT